MGWSYPFWVDNFYSRGTQQKEFLQYYSKKFNTVEIDSTFYRIPSLNTISEWKNSVFDGFKFSVKMHRDITHAKNLYFDESKLNVFLERIQKLDTVLGPILLQFPPWLKSENIGSLENLLKIIPKNLILALEFRNESWFTDSTFKLLRNYDVSIVSVNNQKYFDEKLGKINYFRWEGDREKINGEKGVVEVDRSKEIASWSLKLHSLYVQGRDVFGYFSKFFSGFPPFDVQEMNNQLNLLKK